MHMPTPEHVIEAPVSHIADAVVTLTVLYFRFSESTPYQKWPRKFEKRDCVETRRPRLRSCAGVGVVVPNRALEFAQVLAEPRGVEMRIGARGIEFEATLVAGQRIPIAATILQRDGAVEMQFRGGRIRMTAASYSATASSQRPSSHSSALSRH